MHRYLTKSVLDHSEQNFTSDCENKFFLVVFGKEKKRRQKKCERTTDPTKIKVGSCAAETVF